VNCGNNDGRERLAPEVLPGSTDQLMADRALTRNRLDWEITNDPNLSSGDPAQVLEHEGLEVVTTDHSAGGR
jgi:hypothetical protein